MVLYSGVLYFEYHGIKTKILECDRSLEMLFIEESDFYCEKKKKKRSAMACARLCLQLFGCIFRYLVGQKLVNYEHGKQPTKPASKPAVDAK